MRYIVPGKFPTSCSGCHLFNLDDRDLWCIANHYAGYCRELSKYIDEDKFVKERHPDCPLISIPTPHGRLGDLDKLEKELQIASEDPYLKWEEARIYGKAISDVRVARTIIKAEGET